ncbi:MAG: exodeoxyribonuclease I [Sphingorhabdus sp.]|nr:exodeoxyribonuclease I [Sphingorhabdus sp.]
MGFVFFDTETSGLSPPFDQILQFAAVHTDHDLVEIERFEVRSRLQPHVVPHPAALLVNRLPIARLLDRSLPTHIAMIEAIETRLRAYSPAIFTGYNSIGFDEEMLRHALYQSLYPPYLTSGKGCGRADVYALVQSAIAIDPGCLVVPVKDNGQRDLRLPSLLATNGIRSDSSHDAMADALGTLALCRLLRDRSPEAWQGFVRLSNKSVVGEIVDHDEAFVLTEFFGGEPYHRLVCSLGNIPGNPNGRFCIDLSRDPDEWADMDDEAVRAQICCKGTPLRRVKVNGAPIITTLDTVDEIMPGLDLSAARRRAERYRSSGDFAARLIGIYTADWQSRDASPFAEACLYSGGFIQDEDLAIARDFHRVNWPDRMAIAARFPDARLRSLAERLCHIYARAHLPQEICRSADLALADRLLDAQGGPRTLGEALAATDELLASASSEDADLLSDFKGYLVEREARVRAFRVKAADAAD